MAAIVLSGFSALKHPKGGSDKDDTGLERKVDDNENEESWSA
jgi:hypothetical protein